VIALTFLFLPCAARAAQLVRGPYTENPGPDSAVVRWRVDTATVSWLAYGVAPGCNQFSAISPEAKEHAINLFGLDISKEYCYRVYVPVDGQNAVVEAATGTFRTLRPAEETAFEFMAAGSQAGDNDSATTIGNQMLKFSPDFVLHTGDLSPDGLDASADAGYFAPFSGMLRKAPFFIALGRRDYAPPKTSPKIAGLFLRKNYIPFHQMTPSLASPHYYAFTTANALFIALDANKTVGVAQAPNLTPGSTQYEWLEAELAKSSADWKFILINTPVYSSGPSGINGALAKDLAPLLENYGVDMVFQGTDRDYERTKPLKGGAVSPDDGVIYVTLGGAGDAAQQQSPSDWSEKFLPLRAFGEGVVNANSFTFTAYDEAGDAIDSVNITK